MVFHVGINFFAFPYVVNLFDSSNGKITEYNFRIQHNKNINNSNRYGDENELKQFFENVKSKTNKELGCLCIALLLAENETRKLLINTAINVGFLNVQIIGWKSVLYLHAVTHSDYEPIVGEYIWIFEEACIYIWQKLIDKAIFITSKFIELRDLEKTIKNFVTLPNVMLYNEIEESDILFLKKIFTECKFFSYTCDISINSAHRSALIKARIMANDSEVMQYDVNSVLSHDLCITTRNYNDVWWLETKLSHCKEKPGSSFRGSSKYFQEGLNLPIKRSIIIWSSERKNSLCVDGLSFGDFLFVTYLPMNRKFKVTMIIDKNGIFKVEVQPLEKISKTRNYKKYSIPQNLVVTNDERTIGIDLGTSRCCAAVNRKSGVETVALENTGGRLLPSYVTFESEKNELYGQTAISKLWYLSKSTVFDVKRIIGRKFDDVEIDKSWPFEVLQDEKHRNDNFCNHLSLLMRLLDHKDTFIKIQTKRNSLLKHPEEVSAVLLKYMKQKVQEFVGGISSALTITVPSTFTDSQKDATCAAAFLAGWEYVDLIPEPIAAAFAYLVNQPITQNFTFLLFDLGGGTLNICILKCEKRHMEILHQSGNSNLGGRDFDQILFDYYIQKLNIDNNIKELGNKKYKLMLECQKIKECLSENFEDSLDVVEYDLSFEDFISITRKKFEELSVNLLKKIETCIQDVIEKSEFNHNQIDKVLLVGGGSRMPMIKTLLKTIFPKAEQCCTKHPDEIVAVGVAYYAYYMKSLLQLRQNETLELLKNKSRKRTYDVLYDDEDEDNKKLLTTVTSEMEKLKLIPTPEMPLATTKETKNFIPELPTNSFFSDTGFQKSQMKSLK